MDLLDTKVSSQVLEGKSALNKSGSRRSAGQGEEVIQLTEELAMTRDKLDRAEQELDASRSDAEGLLRSMSSLRETTENLDSQKAEVRHCQSEICDIIDFGFVAGTHLCRTECEARK